MKTHINIGFVSILMLFLLQSCGSTRLVSSWTAPGTTTQHFNKVLVVGLMGSKDRMLRENVEKIIVQQLRSKGINAGSAFEEYGPKTFEEKNEASAIKELRDKGYDGAITVALLDKKKERNYNPDGVGFYPMPYPYRFWGYYSHIYGRIYEPGYYTVTNSFMLEASLYDLTNDKLLYSAQTRSVNPASPQSLASEFSSKIFENMNKSGIFK